jgi:hypothetical protein
MCPQRDDTDPMTSTERSADRTTLGVAELKPNESPAASTPEAASPFPPAFRWEACPSEAPTQVMSAVGQDATLSDATEATPAVRSRPSYPQRPDEVRDLFQPVETPPGGPFTRPSDSSAPPWNEVDLPPIAEQQSAWLRRGTGGFATPTMESRLKQIIGITVLAVVVLGLLGATVGYFLTSGPSRTPDDQIAASQPTVAPRDLPSPPTPRPAPEDTAHALIDPPGEVRGGGGLFDLAQLKNTNLLLPSIKSALQAGAMSEGVFKTTTTDGNTVGLFAFTMPDEKTATTVAEAIATTQLRGGLKADDNRAMKGVTVMGTAPGPASMVYYRAVYVLYNRAIFLEVFGPDRDNVLATFSSLVSQQVNYAPPTVRVGR